jgi:hypothetical protein
VSAPVSPKAHQCWTPVSRFGGSNRPVETSAESSANAPKRRLARRVGENRRYFENMLILEFLGNIF